MYLAPVWSRGGATASRGDGQPSSSSQFPPAAAHTLEGLMSGSQTRNCALEVSTNFKKTAERPSITPSRIRIEINHSNRRRKGDSWVSNTKRQLLRSRIFRKRARGPTRPDPVRFGSLADISEWPDQ